MPVALTGPSAAGDLKTTSAYTDVALTGPSQAGDLEIMSAYSINWSLRSWRLEDNKCINWPLRSWRLGDNECM